MLLVNKATKPEKTIYFVAALLNGILKQKDGLDYSGLYDVAVEKLTNSKINPTVFMLALDFLYLLNKINVGKRGEIYVSKGNEADSTERGNN